MTCKDKGEKCAVCEYNGMFDVCPNFKPHKDDEEVIAERARYRLQRKEPHTLPNVLGNHSMPVHTHKWSDIAISGSRGGLEEYARAMAITLDGKNYRIIDTRKETEENEQSAI